MQFRSFISQFLGPHSTLPWKTATYFAFCWRPLLLRVRRHWSYLHSLSQPLLLLVSPKGLVPFKVPALLCCFSCDQTKKRHFLSSVAPFCPPHSGLHELSKPPAKASNGIITLASSVVLFFSGMATYIPAITVPSISLFLQGETASCLCRNSVILSCISGTFSSNAYSRYQHVVQLVSVCQSQ